MNRTSTRRGLRPFNGAGSEDPLVPPTHNSMSSAPEKGALLLTIEDVSQLVGISVRQIQRLKSLGQFPKEIRIGGSVRWRRVDIEHWVADGCPTLDSPR